MAAHKGPPSLRPRCTRSGSSVAAIPVYQYTNQLGTLLLWNMEGCSFHRAFEIKRHIKRYVKMSCKQVSLSIGALLGNQEGICLLILFG
jgi:hypothetical protein